MSGTQQACFQRQDNDLLLFIINGVDIKYHFKKRGNLGGLDLSLSLQHHPRAEPRHYVEVRQTQRATLTLHNDPVPFCAHL